MLSILKEYIQRVVNEEINQYPEGYYNDKQFRIPFEEYGNGDSYIEHYIDWIKAVSKKGTLPKPSVNFKEEVSKAIEKFYDNKHANRDVDDYGRERKYMTKEELQDYMKNVSTLFEDAEFDQNGNLYVERQIGLHINDMHEESPTLFNELVQSYNNTVGGCWAFSKGKGESYCSGGANFFITFKGYMFLDDIYWEELIRLETRHDMQQYEVRTYPNGRVQLEEIELYDDENYTWVTLTAKDFDGPRIINSTYLGNNEEFNGNYAKLGYEAIGYENQFIDREGNLYKDITDIFSKELESGKKIEDIVNKIEDLGNGLQKVKFCGKFNFINENGELIFPNQWFDECWGFENGFARVKLDDKWNLIDKDGNILSQNQWFDGCDFFKEGFATVKLDDKCNWIDTEGNLLSPNQWFDKCDSFKEGFARVKLNNKYNLIDTQGNLLFPNQWFDTCGKFNDSFAEVELNGKWYWIDKEGNFYDHKTKQPVQSPLQQNENVRRKTNQTLMEARFKNYLNELVREMMTR